MSWNGFPRKLSLKLIDQFKPSTTSHINVIHQDNPDTDLTNPVPKIWLPLPYLGKYGTRLTRSFIHRITPLLKLKCNFIINWKTIYTNSNSFLSNKDKTPAKYQFRCFYTRIKEHSLDNKSEVFNHITSCEHFQHIKSILELYPDEETNPTLTCILSELIFTNSKIIDRSDHRSLLLFKEALAIRRLKPELNHGTKASKELVIFN